LYKGNFIMNKEKKSYSKFVFVLTYITAFILYKIGYGYGA